METETLQKYADYFHFFTGKLVILSEDGKKVLLAQRKGEQEYDACWNFPGGRKERTDADIVENLKREKEEELGTDCKIRVHPHLAFLTHFVRKDGIPVVIGCFPAIYEGGDIQLCDDYDGYEWCDVTNIHVAPLIPGTEDDLQQTLALLAYQKDKKGLVL